MLNGKIAIVTGGTRGIGLAVVRTFLHNGAKVALFGSRETSVQRALAQLREEQPDWPVMGLWPDLTDYAAVERAVQEVAQTFGGVDILVNNAGITRDDLLMRMKESDFDAVINTNLKGTFNTIRHLSRYLLKQRAGKIINISSVSGILGNAGQSNYAASKAGVIGLTKSVARELASRGICVNAVAPGFVETEMTAVLPEKTQEELKKQIPLGRAGQVQDIANAVAFLASPESDYITGQILSVDGGMAI